MNQFKNSQSTLSVNSFVSASDNMVYNPGSSYADMTIGAGAHPEHKMSNNSSVAGKFYFLSQQRDCPPYLSVIQCDGLHDVFYLTAIN